MINAIGNRDGPSSVRDPVDILSEEVRDNNLDGHHPRSDRTVGSTLESLSRGASFVAQQAAVLNRDQAPAVASDAKSPSDVIYTHHNHKVRTGRPDCRCIAARMPYQVGAALQTQLTSRHAKVTCSRDEGVTIRHKYHRGRVPEFTGTASHLEI